MAYKFLKPQLYLSISVKRLFAATALFLFALLSNAGEKVLVETGFESPDDVQILEIADYTSAITQAGDKSEVVSGENSLVLDNMSSRDKFPMLFSFKPETFKNGKLYICTFDYKVIKLGEGKRNHVYFHRDKKRGGEGFLDYIAFGRKVGEKGSIKCVARVPADSKIPTRLAMTSYKGSRIAIDNFKLVERDWNGDWFFDKKIFFGVKNTLVERNFTKLDDPIFEIPRDKFFPMLDQYGQFRHRQWKGKITCDEDFQKRLDEEKKFNASLKKIEDRDKYGGWISKYKFQPTGKFNLAKINDKWFFVTPEGNPFWSLGCNAVGSPSYTTLDEREFYFSELDKNYIFPGTHHSKGYGKPGEKSRVYSFTRRNDFIKYGSDGHRDGKMEKAKRLVDRLQKWGLNTLGAWSYNPALESQRIPYIIQVNSPRDILIKTSSSKMISHWSSMPDFFMPNFQEKLESILEKNRALIESPYCIGVLVDNELSWQSKSGILGNAVLSSPPDQPAKIEFCKMLRKKYSDIEKLNEAWKFDYKDWDDFLSNTDFKTSDTPAFSEDMDSFEKIFAEKYFSACRNAVKKISPGTLYISCRFAWRNPIPVIVASKICDVVAMNLYGLLPSEKTNIPEGFADTPIMIGEFTFARIDKGNFGVYGACACRSQKERISRYKDYITDALNNPKIIGAHWFAWADQPVTGRPDGENYAFGIVDICDTPEYPMVKAMHEISSKMYAIRNADKKDK